MPKEHKHSRGRRKEEKEKRGKRKRNDDDDGAHNKRRKSVSEDPTGEVEFIGTSNTEIAEDDHEGAKAERPFYGLLEDEEQEYFRRADELLELNDFPSEEERSLFLANVFKEADGKELKIACSQSCSRLMERLILLSTVEQKKMLFGRFAENFPHLIQHRFASHCCETLFIQSAQIVTQELTADTKKTKRGDGNESSEAEQQEVLASMESLFLQTLDELEGQMTFLLTDRFASHTLRVLLVILSGRPLEQSSTKSMLQSKRKEQVTITGLNTGSTEYTLQQRAVPSSFQYAVEKIISDTIVTMDTSFIRVLATHPTGNPTLQLLLELELTNPTSKKGSNSEEKTIISSLLPDDLSAEHSESLTFINGLLYDPVGSRLLETICTFAPGKLFKQIYKAVFKDRIAAVSRNEIASYVAIRVLNRINKEDLEEAVFAMLPQISSLVERHRIVIIKTLFERCHARAVDTEALTASVAAAYGGKSESLILQMTGLNDISSLITATQPDESTADETVSPKALKLPKTTPAQLHGSLLAQSMLSMPGPPSNLLQEALLTLPPPILLAFSIYTTSTHTIQSALLPSTLNTVPMRRKLITSLLFPPSIEPLSPDQPLLRLALSRTGSHVLDTLLVSTAAPLSTITNNTTATPSSSWPLFQLAERIASTLILHEHGLRESYTGRIVWRNWFLDLFKRQRGKWIQKVKATPNPAAATAAASAAAPDTALPSITVDTEEDPASTTAKKKPKNNKFKRGKRDDAASADGSGRSAIELARQRFAAAKLARGAPRTNPLARGKGSATGVNAQTVKT